MSDKDKRVAVTSVLVSDIENKSGSYVYGSYTIPLFVQYYMDEGDEGVETPFILNNMLKMITTTNENIEIQNDIVYYNNTFSSMEETYKDVILGFEVAGEKITMSLQAMMDNPRINVLPNINANKFATVKLVNSDNADDAYVAYVPVKDANNALVLTSVYIEIDGEDSAYIPLLNGECVIDKSAFKNVDFTVAPIITGDAEYESQQFIIHGDCTIELSGKESSDTPTD